MKIAVINGSPKGKYSITLQTVLYSTIQQRCPEQYTDRSFQSSLQCGPLGEHSGKSAAAERKRVLQPRDP